MTKAIHLICRRAGSKLLGLEKWSGVANGYRSCCWKVFDAEASSLLGGWIYLHGAKAERSTFGGQVIGFEPGDGAMADRKAVLFRADTNGRGQAWRGADHGMAYTSGVVEADLPHET